jgi:hypothetical protein
LTYRQSSGFFTRLTGIDSLRQTVPFDPATTYIPTTEFFDDRTYYVSSQLALTYQKSARLSFNFGGGGFLIDHSAKGLYGTRGATAYADAQYRMTRRATVGGIYQFSTFRNTGIYGDSYIHGTAGSFGYQFSRTLEFSGFAGVMRPESKFVQSVPLDPAIAALIGVSTGRQVVHSVSLRPFWSGRISKTFSSGVLYGSGGQTVAPGNGLFLTSYTTSMMAGYAFTGLRRWSFSANVRRTASKSIANVAGPYDTVQGGFSVSRKLTSSIHLVASALARHYSSSVFDRYNRTTQSFSLGIGYSPGDVPLRLW